MHCEEYWDLISGHVDGVNSEADETRLQAHLRECAHCRALLEAYSSIDAMLAQEDAEPPAALKGNIMQAVKAAPEKRRSKKSLFMGIGSGLAAAACLAVILFSIPNLEKSMNDAVNEAAFDSSEAPGDPQDSLASPDNTGAADQWWSLETPPVATGAYRRPVEDYYNYAGVPGSPIVGTDIMPNNGEAAELSETPLLIIWSADPADIPGLEDLMETDSNLSSLELHGGHADSLYERLLAVYRGGPPDSQGAAIHSYETDLATLQSIAAGCGGYEYVVYYPSEMTEDAVCTVLVVEPQDREDLPSE